MLVCQKIYHTAEPRASAHTRLAVNVVFSLSPVPLWVLTVSRHYWPGTPGRHFFDPPVGGIG